MPKSFAKVHKHVSKKKGSKPTALHENSRDSRSLIRASARDQRVQRTEAVRRKLNLPYLQRMLFVQQFFRSETRSEEAAVEALRCFTLAEVQEAIATFLKRNDEELDELRSSRRPGRPASAREEALRLLASTEAQEYEAGFWMPDLVSGDVANVKMFKEWKGGWVGLNVVKFVRITSDGQVKPSAWPPKGNS